MTSKSINDLPSSWKSDGSEASDVMEGAKLQLWFSSELSCPKPTSCWSSPRKRRRAWLQWRGHISKPKSYCLHCETFPTGFHLPLKFSTKPQTTFVGLRPDSSFRAKVSYSCCKNTPAGYVQTSHLEGIQEGDWKYRSWGQTTRATSNSLFLPSVHDLCINHPPVKQRTMLPASLEWKTFLYCRKKLWDP